jgi:hypothetical protein
VHAAACEQFSTVLAPGSNAFHYDHIHVDLMRRGSSRRVCNPEAIPGDVVAARAQQRRFGNRPGRDVTGSIAPGAGTPALGFAPEPDRVAPIEALLPRAIPGED